MGLEHALLLGAIVILGPLYFFVWWEHPDLQKKMQRMSMFGAIAGPIADWWYLGDYWESNFIGGPFGVIGLVEDLAVAYLLIGLTAVSVNILEHQKSVPGDKGGDRKRYLIAFVIAVGALIILSGVFGVPSLYASSIGFFAVAVLIWHDRPDLVPHSLTGGIALISFALIAYVAVLIGRLDVHVPVQECLWLFSWGLVGSVLWEWRHGCKFIDRNPHGKPHHH